MVMRISSCGDHGNATRSRGCRCSAGLAKGGSNAGGEIVAASVGGRKGARASCDSNDEAARRGSDSSGNRKAASEVSNSGEGGTISKRSDGGEEDARTSGGCDGGKEEEATWAKVAKAAKTRLRARIATVANKMLQAYVVMAAKEGAPSKNSEASR